MPRSIRKSSTKKVLKTYTCLRCNNVKTEKDFYKNADSIVPYCKECLMKMCINPNGEFSITDTKTCLKLINRPFYYQKIKELIEDESIGVPTKVAKYFQWISIREKLSQTWEDSQDENYSDPLTKAREESKNPSPKVVDKEKIKKWNTNDKQKVKWLEDEYSGWERESPTPITSKAQKELVVQMCLTKWQISQLQKEGKDVPAKLYDTYQKLMGDAGLKPVQEANNPVSDQMSFGMFIQMIENERPIIPLSSDEPDNFDKIHLWICGQLAKMQGYNSQINGDYEKILREYSCKDIEEQFEDTLDEELDEEEIKEDNGDSVDNEDG